MRAAIRLAEDVEMTEHLRRLKQLPIKGLMASTGLSQKVLENGRKYIIATALLMIEPEFAPLKRFVHLAFDEKK